MNLAVIINLSLSAFNFVMIVIAPSIFNRYISAFALCITMACAYMSWGG